MSDLLVYGAYGYSGKPITEAAVAKGLRPIVAGRDRTQTDALAEAHGLESRSFPLDDPAGLAAGLRGVKAVLHCAGPFSATSRPMLDACVRQGVHYLDITGEFRVMEAVAARDGELRAAGVMAMCGTGMDVVPTDCLAAHMKRRMPDAQRLDLYVRALEKLSPGTALTMLEGAGLPNVVREGGRLVEKRAGAARRKVAFPSGRVTMVGMPWGDICSAWYTTGIPNIAVHMSLMPGAAAAIALGGCFRGLLQAPSVQRRLKAAVRRHVRGPTPGERDAARCEFVAEATDRAGNLRRTYLVTREGYAFTIDSAVEIADRVLKGAAKPGYQTPAGLFGPDFVLEFAGSQRQDLA
jgi:short subunit dehydrogenase-like uncharacterized protein